jgi:hypothetical protein
MVLPLDTGTFWLNFTNCLLGGLTAASLIAVIVVALRSVRRTKRKISRA